MPSFEIFYPERAYPELFDDVMKFHLFPDSKTFADSTPRISPEEIRFRYQKIDRSDRNEIKDFADQWFELPEIGTPVQIEPMPIDQHLHSLWDHLLRQPDQANPNSSLIPLPYSYIVPGGRFREIYYWDSYFTMLGMKVSGRIDIIRDMISNFAWQIDHIGHIPNGNRSYFLSRSQPPFFSLMIQLLAEIDGDEVYLKYLPQLLKEYSFWMDGIETGMDQHRRIVKTGDGYLNRYYDDNDLPRSESYAEDMELFETSGKPAHLFQNLRAACESGWDFSSRWFADGRHLASINTLNIIPVDLNSLLYLLEKSIETAYRIRKNGANVKTFGSKADQRAEWIRTILWNKTDVVFGDLDFTLNKFGIPSLAMAYPLFAGIASPEQAASTIQFLSDHFLKPGGWVTTNQNTGQQWDAPNGWAPLQWITFVALNNYGATAIAKEAARRWLSLNEEVFKRTGKMMEKYNVEDLSLDAGGGEYPVQDGFGWTNGVFLSFKKDIT